MIKINCTVLRLFFVHNYNSLENEQPWLEKIKKKKKKDRASTSSGDVYNKTRPHAMFLKHL